MSRWSTFRTLPAPQRWIFQLLSADDPAYQQIANVLSGVRCVRRLSQNYSSYSHEYPVDSITVSYYDDAEQHQLLLTVYSDGVCIVNSAFVNVKYSGGGAEDLYQEIAGDRRIKQKSGRAGGQAARPVFVFFARDAVPITPNAAPEAAEQIRAAASF